jgi:hypothetical protein
VLEYGVDRMVINSAADWGVSDPMMVPKSVAKLREAGYPEAQIQRLVWDNPIDFFAQSGRIDRAVLESPVGIDRRQTFTGNSVLRGQDPNAR